MKIDVIITNPPYQKTTGGRVTRAIFQEFVEVAIKAARHVVMLIPARWIAEGIKMESFRQEMSQGHLKALEDIPNARDAFPDNDIPGGVCYFHWDNHYCGPCQFNGKPRRLDQEGLDIILRDIETLPTLKKALGKSERFLSETVTKNPFGLGCGFQAFVEPSESSVACITKEGTKHIQAGDIQRGHDLVEKWKTICSVMDGLGMAYDPEKKQEILRNIRVIPPNTVCLEAYLVISSHSSQQEAENAASYLNSKLPRFLLGLRKLTQHTSGKHFQWVPIMDWKHPWDDQKLYEHFELTEEEILTVEKKIR